MQLIQMGDLAKPEMRKLNPVGKVPILDDDGWILYENGSVLNYVADKFPEAKLAGDGTPKSRAEVNRWLSIINSDVHPAFKPLFGTTKYLADQAAIEKTHQQARKELRSFFELFDAQLGRHDWLAGTRSIADPYLFVTLRWAHAVKVDLSGLENLKKFEQRMHADAGVQRALKDEKLDQAA